MRRRSFLILLAGLILLPDAVSAAPADEPVTLSADSLVLDQETGLYRAEGDVLIEQGELQLTAGSADWNQATGQAVCSGGIRLESPQGVLTGESLTYDFSTGLGLLRDGDARLDAYSIYLSGDVIEKTSAVGYRVSGGSFTTCGGPNPAWRLTASRLDVDVEGYARARHAVFHIRRLPVFYLPYIALPAKTDRQSGLLFPDVGHSNRLGYRYSQPYYLVIDDHMDATLTLDVMTDFGIGTGLEYRYLPAEGLPGRLYGNFISGHDDEPDRALVEWEHDGLLPGRVRLAADVDYISKKDYYRIFGDDPDIYNSEKSQSTVLLSRAWNKTVLYGRGTYTRDLVQSSADQLQYLPEVRFDYLPQRFAGTPLFAALTGEAAYLWQRDGFKGERFRLAPTVSSDLLVTKALEIVPSFTWLQRNYHFEGTDAEEGLPVANLRIGSRLARVFTLNGRRVTHLRHAVEPMLHYLYVPNVDQSHLPLLDGRDRVEPQNLVTFELMNRFTLRVLGEEGTPRFREVASLRLAVDYDIREERRDEGPPPDDNRPFSPIRGELILRPTDVSFLRGDIAYDADSDIGQVESWAAWGGFHDRRGNGLLVNYTYRRDDYDYLSGNVDVALLAPLYVSYEQRYDVESRDKLEDVAQLEYRGRCWSILLSYRDRPDEEQVSVRFALGGISNTRLIRSTTRPLKNFL